MIQSFIKAARLRTLPLSVSGIIVGSFLGLNDTTSNLLSKISVSLDIENDSILRSPVFWLAVLNDHWFSSAL